MANDILIEEKVALNDCPGNIRQHEATQRIVIGDLDGSMMKLMRFLIKEGIISLPPNLEEVTYTRLVTLYAEASKELTQPMYRNYCMAWNEMKVLTPRPQVLLLGDDLCDRGANDLLLLTAYQYMSQHDIHYDIIASNHGMDFIRQLLSAGGLTGKSVNFYTGYYGHSLAALIKSISQDWISESDVVEMAKKFYLPKIRLVSYDLADQGVILYTHAPVHPGQIKEVFNFLNGYSSLFGVFDKIEFNAATPQDFILMLEKLNKYFQLALNVASKNKYFYDIFFRHRGPIDNFVNGRYVDLANTLHDGSYPVKNVHGHVGDEKIESDSEESASCIADGWSYVNLDGMFGMPLPGGAVSRKGLYKVFVAKATPRATLQLPNNASHVLRPMPIRAMKWGGLGPSAADISVKNLQYDVLQSDLDGTTAYTLCVSGMNPGMQKLHADRYADAILAHAQQCNAGYGVQALKLDFSRLSNAEINLMYEAFNEKVSLSDRFPALQCVTTLENPSRDWGQSFYELTRIPSKRPKR